MAAGTTAQSRYSGGNYCPVTVQRRVTCLVQNGTEEYSASDYSKCYRTGNWNDCQFDVPERPELTAETVCPERRDHPEYRDLPETGVRKAGPASRGRPVCPDPEGRQVPPAPGPYYRPEQERESQDQRDQRDHPVPPDPRGRLDHQVYPVSDSGRGKADIKRS
ncbi:hypothetical protein FJT64_006860 [Amphibalanus amphitrite]|uniref:Uncharacterized protein n=1 Tax=Amphibalanus amphitrite TaxID=1232801 RepID=A0A6A4VW66_AMPAM|nr:hypothetical protein FJT64_006860 [Amphibalanus amphitrite]